MPWWAFLAPIFSIFVSVGNIVWKVVQAVWPLLQTTFDVLKTVIKGVSSAVGTFARSAWKGLRFIWERAIEPVLLTFKRWWERFEEFLRKVFKPIFDVIDKALEILDKIYVKVIRPILDAIRRARLVFRGLELLGVGWAGKVEEFLQKLEWRIYNSFLETRRYINTIVNTLNDLLAPEGWIYSRPFLLSVQRWGGGLLSILVGLGIPRDLEARIEATAGQWRLFSEADLIEELRSGSFRNNPDVQAAVAEFKSRPFSGL